MKYYIDLSDKRNVYLKSFLEMKGFDVCDYSKIEKHQVFKKGDRFVFSPAKKFDEFLLKSLPRDITLYCGAIPDNLNSILEARGIKHVNLLKNETYAIKNAKLTAEGVLSLIIEKSEKSIYENHILILGAGRVAKSCAILFKNLNLKFSIASFNKEKFPENFLYSESNLLGNEFVNKLKNYDVIINTIPARIFDNESTQKINNGTLFIETASKECLDKNIANHFSYVLAPGLPQKYCAQSAGKLILENILGEEE